MIFVGFLLLPLLFPPVPKSKTALLFRGNIFVGFTEKSPPILPAIRPVGGAPDLWECILVERNHNRRARIFTEPREKT